MRRLTIFLVLLTITSPVYAADEAEGRTIEMVLGNNGSGGAYLGVSFVKNQPEFYKFTKYYNADLSGVLVSRVVPGRAAEKAGIKVGDIITVVGANKIRDNAELLRILAEKFRPGSAVKIKVFRNSLGFIGAVEKSATAGDATAQYLLGVTKENSSPEEAAMWHRKAAEQGNARAQTNLGFMYEYGKGVKRDDSEAVKWYRKAAEQEDALAQTNLGIMYRFGQGVKEDDSEAVKWFRKGAEQGDARAQTHLGFMYESGKGVKEDDNEAVKWYRKAAEQGNATAQTHLGFMYRRGRGVKQDDKEAVKWYRKGAEQGNVDAQYNLGFMYRDGRGVKQDNSESAKWYRKAADQGDADAKKALAWIYINKYLIYVEIAVLFLLGVILLKRRRKASA